MTIPTTTCVNHIVNDAANWARIGLTMMNGNSDEPEITIRIDPVVGSVAHFVGEYRGCRLLVTVSQADDIVF